MTNLRRAGVIGVNEYEDEKIENLSGAVLDATEIRDILKANGNFTIDNDHFLTDKKATSEKIRRAISDLFWNTEKCEIALFYFSGHGRRDHFEHGYLLPTDADHTAPFVKGIRIQELKELFLCTQPKKTGVMVLDCCYSGIATERGTPDEGDHIKGFHKELSIEGTGTGRFILASADADKTAREEEREHALSGEKHVHGLYSFHLIEGLRIGRRDQYGRVSLGALMQHLDDALQEEPKRRPQQYVGAGSGIHDIFLATIPEELQASRMRRYSQVENFLAKKTPMDLMVAIQILTELESHGLGCEEIDLYLKCASDELSAY